MIHLFPLSNRFSRRISWKEINILSLIRLVVDRSIKRSMKISTEQGIQIIDEISKRDNGWRVNGFESARLINSWLEEGDNGDTRRPIISRSWFNADKSELWLFPGRTGSPPFLPRNRYLASGLRLSGKFYPEEIYYAAPLPTFIPFCLSADPMIESWILIGIILGGSGWIRLFRQIISKNFLPSFYALRLFVCLLVRY